MEIDLTILSENCLTFNEIKQNFQIAIPYILPKVILIIKGNKNIIK